MEAEESGMNPASLLVPAAARSDTSSRSSFSPALPDPVALLSLPPPSGFTLEPPASLAPRSLLS